MPSKTHARFAVWIFATIGVLTADALSCFAISVAFLVLILTLLCTTPPHAIRLPRAVSEIFILLSTCAIDWRRGALPLGIHLGVLLLMLMVLRLWGKSPWWAVLYGWFPV